MMMMIIKFVLIAAVAVATSKEIPDAIKEKLENLIKSKRIERDFEPYDEPELNDDEEYDFVIVGAGSGGSALINRLSEVAKFKILVLEAGGDPSVLTDVPLLAPLAHFTDQNWRFYTEPEENFGLGLENRRMHWPRGKGIGGTSLLNYMVFSRGAAYDYDRWGESNPGWSYRDLLPIFKRLEDCRINRKDEEFRGDRGEVKVEDSSYRTVGTEIFLEAAKSSGYSYVDYNGKNHVGASYIQSTTRDGFRCSGERCFVRKAKDRTNVTIRKHAHVTKVLIDDHRRAYGVEFFKYGRFYRALARKEVVLCAGVINSAHILFLSGIGPEDMLKKFNIEPIKDLPVGKKIYDHPAYYGLVFTTEEKLDFDKSKILDDQEYVKLFSKRKSVLHNTGGLEALVFSTTSLADDENLSDIEIIHWSYHLGSGKDYGLGRSMGLSREIYDKVFKPLEGKNLLSAIVILMRPESYGQMELQSSNPFVHPKIYGGYLTDPEGKDVKVFVAGIRETIRIYTSEPFRKYGIKLVDTPIPGCESHEFDSDGYWECALRHITTTIYHHTTTCKMGPKDDPEAVVDSRLRVYGIKNLRVADTSVIPVQITGHTNVPAFMVGEKAADLIKEDHLKIEL